MIRSFAALALIAGLGLAARADVLPPPSQLTTYTVELGPDLSALLAVSVPFQTSKASTVRACHASVAEKTFVTGDSKIICQEGYYCMGHHPAVCTVTFRGYKGQTAADIVTSVTEKK